jgi:hypothetical protein
MIRMRSSCAAVVAIAIAGQINSMDSHFVAFMFASPRDAKPQQNRIPAHRPVPDVTPVAVFFHPLP